MGRSAKARRVCRLPKYARFEPQPDEAKAPVRMEVEDFECIRLMDYLGMTQEECAVQMGVARTTVQAGAAPPGWRSGRRAAAGDHGRELRALCAGGSSRFPGNLGGRGRERKDFYAIGNPL